MRRMFWLAVGATAGVYTVRKVQKTLDAYRPSSLATRASGIGGSLRGFAEQVRADMAERERQLRDALGLDGVRQLDAADAAFLTDHPATLRSTAVGTAPGATAAASTDAGEHRRTST